MTVEKFVGFHLPDAPSRVLEVGCGTGELAQALVKRGHTVTAIDPDAPDGDIFRKTSLEEFSEPGSFDAVVASRSLHHIPDLEAGLKKIHALLRANGLLILNEFAWDQMDERTARWYLSHVLEPRPEDESLRPERFPEAWVTEHQGLHDSITMRTALDSHFHLDVFEWVPYIAEYYLQRTELVGQEEELIESGEINAMGFQYVGTRR